MIRQRLAADRGASPRLRGDHDLNPDTGPAADCRPAAVLVPLVEHRHRMTVLLTRRAEHLEHHPGQISFPGGHCEEGDTTPEDTALREAAEEVGLEPGQVETVGRLDTYVTRTGFSVVPVVGLVRPPLVLRPDPLEVAEAFEVPLDFLLDPANHRRMSRRLEGRERHFHAMAYGDYYIWGATAGMLMDLYERLVRP